MLYSVEISSFVLQHFVWRSAGCGGTCGKEQITVAREKEGVRLVKISGRSYLLQPLCVILHGTLQSLQLPLLPWGPVLLGPTWLGLTWLDLRWGVALQGIGHLEVLQRLAVLHLWENERVAAGAVLHAVLLALRGDGISQQVGQVGKGQGQQAAHIRARKNKKGRREEGAIGAPSRQMDPFFF